MIFAIIGTLAIIVMITNHFADECLYSEYNEHITIKTEPPTPDNSPIITPINSPKNIFKRTIIY